MSAVASIVVVLLSLAVIRLALWAIKAREDINALRDRVEDQAETIDGIQDAIAASPAVTYPYIYTNATHEP